MPPVNAAAAGLVTQPAPALRDAWGAALLLLALVWRAARGVALLLLSQALHSAASLKRGLADAADAARRLSAYTARAALRAAGPEGPAWVAARAAASLAAGALPQVLSRAGGARRLAGGGAGAGAAACRGASLDASLLRFRSLSLPPAGDGEPGSAGSAGGGAAAGPFSWQRRQSCPGASAPAVAPLPPPRPLLPPQLPYHAGRLTVCLDLDETLVAPVRSRTPPHPRGAGGAAAGAGGWAVVPRPGVHAFLEQLSARAELVLWTAAAEEYAAAQLRLLDPAGRLFAARICGETTPLPGRGGGGAAGGGAGRRGAGAAKDLSRLPRDPARVVLVDNALPSMALQPDNGIPCPPYRGEADDQVLLRVILPLVLKLCEYGGDVRPILAPTIRLREWMEGRGAGGRPRGAAAAPDAVEAAGAGGGGA
ncbi:MAG: HAD-like domain-containing protein [Monoraphidium minutum]|nr:MAG: HAD-like domain-containing protein [Monoraphidium minutum]